MGYSGKLKEKEMAVKLRKKGCSYGEIKEQVGVSKDTISRWCRDVILTAEQYERLAKSKLEGAAKGRLIGSKVLQNRRIVETRELRNIGITEVGSLSKRDKFMLGIALYVAEGTKSDRQVVFANSDPALIRFMTEWFIEFCGLELNKLRCRLWIHENRSIEKAIKYWTNVTGIPGDHFHKPYVIENKSKSRKIRKNVHEYGVVSVAVTNSRVHRRIMGWIAGIEKPYTI